MRKSCSASLQGYIEEGWGERSNEIGRLNEGKERSNEIGRLNEGK